MGADARLCSHPPHRAQSDRFANAFLEGASALKRGARHAKAPGARLELKLEDLQGLVARAKSSLSENDHATLAALVDTLAFLTQELAAKGASLERLRRFLFGGQSTEKTSKIFGKEPPAAGTPGEASTDAKATGSAGERPPRPGHGRNGAAAYSGATKVKVPHTDLHRGDSCPGCMKGKVYPLAEPAVLVRIQGMAPLGATVYECEQLRCNLCGEVFAAPAPAGVGNEKYDDTAAAMIGMLKYGAGLPFNRIQKLERGMGIPLPASTQWLVVERAAKQLAPAHRGLLHEAAQGEVLHNDDTSMKILELTEEARREILADAGDKADERTGVFTSGIVATRQGHRMALFFTGPKHAGENLGDVLRRRDAELSAPIQMCDALDRNLPGEFKTVLANCLAHGRRHFVDVVNDFPEECRFLLETLGEVYKNDDVARQRGLGPEDRLRLHQEQSGPLMEKLETWLREHVEEHKVEPNSGLGEAIAYMRNHWEKLTLFLHVAGAPLDNSICERALKRAILHRKNALFYKTLNGAHVGDLFMSLIHTAELNGVEPFEYLVALLRHHDHVVESPADWMPWNYKVALGRLTQGPSQST
jgi:transposase